MSKYPAVAVVPDVTNAVPVIFGRVMVVLEANVVGVIVIP